MAKRKIFKAFRFSFRTVFILFTLLCVSIGWLHTRVQTQRRAIHQLAELGVKFDYYNYRPAGYFINNLADEWPPDWLVNLLGPDYFQVPVSCSIHEYKTGGKSETRRQIFAQLLQLPKIESLYYPSTSDEQAVANLISELPNLRRLNIFEPEDPISFFSSLESLEQIHFPDGISNDTFSALAKIQSLQEITLEMITEEQRQTIRKLRPEIKISCHDDYPP